MYCVWWNTRWARAQDAWWQREKTSLKERTTYNIKACKTPISKEFIDDDSDKENDGDEVENDVDLQVRTSNVNTVPVSSGAGSAPLEISLQASRYDSQPTIGHAPAQQSLMPFAGMHWHPQSILWEIQASMVQVPCLWLKNSERHWELLTIIFHKHSQLISMYPIFCLQLRFYGFIQQLTSPPGISHPVAFLSKICLYPN